LIRANFTPPTSATNSSRLLTLIAVVAVIVGLYFGRDVLIPLALGVVLAFLLSPVVDGLQKCHFGRVPAVLTVLLLAFSVVASLGWIVSGQLLEIVDQIPSYKSTIHDKIQSLRLPSGSRFKNATNTVTELSAELSAASESAVEKNTATKSHSRPLAVQMAQPPANAPQYVRAILGPLTGVLETLALVIVFTLFMLVKREDLRNRVIRLAGADQLNTVTQALHDASRRLSRYLLLQFVVNISYGVIFGIGAYLIGIPHALLWAVLAGLLRFVPYVGAPIGALIPAAMALAVFPGWHQGAFIFGLYVVVELALANFIEPWLYGSHTGISSLAILVAAVFWGVLWGPVGLILSTPLTVCLILMGRYVPQLSFLEVLLGDEPVLPLEAHFYQRLLALDQEEAREIAEAYLKEKTIGSFYDSVLIPALSLSEQDRHLNSLEARTSSFVSQSTRELIEELGERFAGESFSGTSSMFNSDESHDGEMERTALAGLRVLCIPAGDDADELVTMMAEQLLKRLGCNVRRLPIADSAGLVQEVGSDVGQAVVVSAVPPFTVGQARSLCKVLRSRLQDPKIILGLWGFEGDVAKAKARVGPGCGEMVVVSLQQAIAALLEMQQPLGVNGSELPESGFVKQPARV
jgi:predicted PurR-regulated permease PerM